MALDLTYDPDAVCRVCGETWLDSNGLRHADASSNHAFTPLPFDLCLTCMVVLSGESAIETGPCERCGGDEACKTWCACEEQRMEAGFMTTVAAANIKARQAKRAEEATRG